MDEDIEFSFNPKPFEKAMKQMAESYETFTNTLQKETKQTAKESVVKTKEMGLGFLRLSGFISVAQTAISGIRNVLNKIPEIGIVMKRAGDIIQRNLLWPLRLQLLPMLQKVLDWVKNNRTLFVKWGSVIVNVFKTIKVAFAAAWRIAKNFVDGFKGIFTELFDLTGKRIFDMVNLVIFKITALLIIVEGKLAPIAKAFGKLFGTIVKDIKAFADGFVDGFSRMAEEMGIMEDIKSIIGEFSEFFGRLAPLLEKLNPLFRVFGDIIGTYVAVRLKLLIKPIELILGLVNDLIAVFTGEQTFKELGNKFVEGTMANLADLKDFFGEKFEQGKNLITKRPNKIEDAIVKPDGSIIHTDPQDTIIATKGSITRNAPDQGGSRQIGFGDLIMNLTVTEGNAASAGQQFGTNALQVINNGLLSMITDAGGIK